MKKQCKEFLLLLLINVSIQVVKSHTLQRTTTTGWPNARELSGDNKYEEISLVQPRFKSKKLAGLEWSKNSWTDSTSDQSRHLEWLDSSDNDQESASADTKGLLAGFLDDDNEDSDKKEETETELLRRRERKKYVRVDRMIFPLLLAYKLKYFTLIPILIGALTLLVSATGLAGFFFALFAAAAGLHHHKGHHG